MNISFIIPTRNNLDYIKSSYNSIRKYYLQHEIIILDDNSSDGTSEWLKSLNDDNLQKYYYTGKNNVGHVILYDEGIKIAKNEIISIFHADMICGKNYVENLLKHWKPKTIVSSTRIEPPLHPPGKEKIIKDFGKDIIEFKENEFSYFCEEKQKEFNNQTTKGIFAPWLMSKTDFQLIGGNDYYYSPQQYEDSDFFQRAILAGYNIIQSRDSFVYHFTCRGCRGKDWNKNKKEDLFYKLCCAKNTAHFIRKWGSWIQNDENCYPIINKKYDIGFVVQNCNVQILNIIEPWCSTLYVDINPDSFINQVKPGTPFDMKKRIKRMEDEKTNEILVYFDAKKMKKQEQFNTIINLPKIITNSGEIGKLEYDIFTFDIRGMTSFETNLVNNDSEYYKKQLKPVSSEDPYCLNTLFEIYKNIKHNV